MKKYKYKGVQLNETKRNIAEVSQTEFCPFSLAYTCPYRRDSERVNSFASDEECSDSINITFKRESTIQTRISTRPAFKLQSFYFNSKSNEKKRAKKHF